jgi:hypothetical protein
MKCPYETCHLRTRDEICIYFAETCKIYHSIRRHREEIAEREKRFGEMQAEDIKRVYQQRT